MEAKAMLEDQVEDLLSKIDLLDVLKGETAQLKAQVDALTSVSVYKQLNSCTYLIAFHWVESTCIYTCIFIYVCMFVSCVFVHMVKVVASSLKSKKSE